MKEIVERLNENRQIELAKSILESNGYKIEKRLKESFAPDLDNGYSMTGEEVKESMDEPETEYYLRVVDTVQKMLHCPL